MFVDTGTAKQLRRRHLSFAESKQENKVSKIKIKSYIILMITILLVLPKTRLTKIEVSWYLRKFSGVVKRFFF